MIEEYATRIESLFYLKENTKLTNNQRNECIKGILSEFRNKSLMTGERRMMHKINEAILNIETKLI